MSAKQAFISYSHKDAIFVHTFALLLKSQNFNIWIDYNLSSGSVWTDELGRQIDASEVFILILSPNIKDSEWVKEEIAYAKKQKKLIIPIIYNPSRTPFDIPFGLNSIQAIDLSNQPNYWLGHIVNELDKRIGRQLPDVNAPVIANTNVFDVEPSKVLDSLLLGFADSAVEPITVDQLILFLSENKLIHQQIARKMKQVNTSLAVKQNQK